MQPTNTITKGSKKEPSDTCRPRPFMGPHKNSHNCVVHKTELNNNQAIIQGWLHIRLNNSEMSFKSPLHHMNAVKKGKVESIRQAKVCSLSKGFKKKV